MGSGSISHGTEVGGSSISHGTEVGGGSISHGTEVGGGGISHRTEVGGDVFISLRSNLNVYTNISWCILTYKLLRSVMLPGMLLL